MNDKRPAQHEEDEDEESPLYTLPQRMRFAWSLLDTYMAACQGMSVTVSEDVAHWFYWETHSHHLEGPVVNHSLGQFISDHTLAEAPGPVRVVEEKEETHEQDA